MVFSNPLAFFLIFSMAYDSANVIQKGLQIFRQRLVELDFVNLFAGFKVVLDDMRPRFIADKGLNLRAKIADMVLGVRQSLFGTGKMSGKDHG